MFIFGIAVSKLLGLSVAGAGGYALYQNRAQIKNKLPVLRNIRQNHQAILQNNDKLQTLSQAEQTARRNLLLTGVGLCFATIGLLGYPLFYLFSVVISLYYLSIFSRMAYHDFLLNRKISDKAMNVVQITLSLLFRFYFALAASGFFIMFIRYLTVKTEDHSMRNLADVFNEHPQKVWVLVDNVEVEIPFEQLQKGDTVIVYAGQTIPVDGTVRKGTAAVDQHMLTGESQLVEKSVGDKVFSTTLVLSGRIDIGVEHTHEDSVAAQVGTILNQTTDYRQTLQSRAQILVDKVTLPTFGVAGVVWATLSPNSGLGTLMVYPGYRLLFLNPISMLGFLDLSARHGLLIKDGRCLELLNTINMVVFDKTGTLTLDQLAVTQIHCCADVSEQILLQWAAMAEAKQQHPIAQAILAEATHRGISVLSVDDAEYTVGFGIQVIYNTQIIRVGSERFMMHNGIVIPPTLQAEQARSHDCGNSLVMVALDEQLIGAIELAPQVRPETPAVIQQLKARGLKVAIISGDHEAPTRHLANDLQIDEYFAEVLPAEKASIIERLEAAGNQVCFVGDGINDAIALKTATASISLRGATTIATDTAQVVLMDGNLTRLAQLFEFAKQYQNNIKVNLVSSVAPAALYLGGAYAYGWGYLTAIVIQQTISALALINVTRPLMKEPKQNASAAVLSQRSSEET